MKKSIRMRIVNELIDKGSRGEASVYELMFLMTLLDIKDAHKYFEKMAQS